MSPPYVGKLIGDHSSINEVRHLVEKVARSQTHAVLLYGETGTGKGLVARMIHDLSARATSQFIDINCAAIPTNLIETELFGHEKGAFTGAQSRKTGLVEAANNGSVFLDEIRELDHVMQAKLLSLLDTQRFRRVGAIKDIEVDVRFIAATNKILFREVQEGRFRDDLYYRLQVVAVNIPPLRDRGNDCLILTDHFIRTFNSRYDRLITGIEPTVREIFLTYPWPGNVRELENLLERIFILEDDNQVHVKHIPDRIMRVVEGREKIQMPDHISTDFDLDYHDATAAFQRAQIERALARGNGSLTKASNFLNLSRHALRHQMEKLGMR